MDNFSTGIKDAYKELSNSIGMETVYLIYDKKIIDLGFIQTELKFLKDLIKDEAVDFKISVKSGLSDSQKLRLVKDYIRDYDKIMATAVPIRNL